MLTEQEKSFLDALAKAPVPGSIADLRKMMESFAPMMNQNPPEVGAFHEDVELRPGLRADIAVPKGAGPHPVVVYLHGGGWVAGSPKSHRKLGMQFADAGYLTINVDYRLAPEHPFPAGLDDCVFAIKWAGQNAAKYHGDSNRIAVGGDSAGGNLTAASVTSLAAENYSGPKPRAALLIYGLFDFPAQLKASGGNAMITEMTKAYAGSAYPDILKDPRVSPIFAVKPGALPPSFVVCGTADTLVSDSRTMAEALKRADIRHEVHIYDDIPHGFLQMDNLSACRDAFGKMVDFLKRTI
ncbi:MAG TPA: alpha/beta hydrolase [Candidatus Binataceae bacterium]|nr:alpha/beta hydrolase [Candidatus Binataceae bacterium]